MLPESKSSNFQKILKENVNTYLINGHHKTRDLPSFYFKITVVLLWISLSYYGLVFTRGEIFYKLLLSLSLALAVPAVLFNMTHDANHFSISKHKLINTIFCFSADLIGVSSTIWRIFHNRHHRNPNVFGLDFDLDQGYLLRFSPYQEKHWFHAYQVFYSWFLFPFILIRRNFIKDFSCLTKILREEKGVITKIDLCTIFIGKLTFFSLAFILPSFYYSIPVVLLFYFLIYSVAGIIISVTFILTHINDKVVFSSASNVTKSNSDFIDQIATSVDFSRNNPVLRWYLGGLNFQTEHHLFPHICHIHYPAISKIVEKTCTQFNIQYKSNNTLYEAVTSYCRWLNYLGKAI